MSADPIELTPAPDSPPQSSASSNPLQIILRRWPFLVVGLLIGVVTGLLIFVSTPPVFESVSQVLVVKKRAEMVKEGDVRVGAVEDYVATQVTLIKSEKIRMGAAREARQKTFARPLPPDDRAVAELIRTGLTVARDKESVTSPLGTGVLNLTFRGPAPGDCRNFLDALITAYQTELYAIYEQATSERLAALDRMMDAVKNQRKDAAEERVKRQLELREITTEEVPSIRARVTAQREQLYTLQTELVNLDDQLAMIEKAPKNRRDRQLLLFQLTSQYRPTGAGGGPGPEGVTTDSTLRAIELQLSEMSQTLGKDHPRIVALKAQLAFLRDEAGRQTANGGAATLDELDMYGKWVEQRKKSTDRQLAQFKGRLAEDEKKLTAAGGTQDRIESLGTQLIQLDSDIKRLEADKLTTQATQSAGGFSAEKITPPSDGRKVAPVLVQSIIAGIGIGVLLGAGMMLLAEFSDKSFRSPVEIRQRLGLPILGHIPPIRTTPPADGGPTAGFAPTLVTALRPKSVESEAYRGLRTQLYFSTNGRGHQVLQVTSPNPGDGKSTLAANLAISVAQSGKRVVLVDCDFRKPRVHKLFSIPAGEVGLAGVISGQGDPAAAIHPSGVPNLDLLPCGPRPTNPAELLSSPQFQVVLDELRKDYELVIVDTPPILAVSDPAAVAPRVDGVLLVFRMTKKARPAAERAREQLALLGANVLGVVVNGWSAAGRGYYSYNYNYGYTYGYRYTDYTYSDSYSDNSDQAGAGGDTSPAAGSPQKAG